MTDLLQGFDSPESNIAALAAVNQQQSAEINQLKVDRAKLISIVQAAQQKISELEAKVAELEVKAPDAGRKARTRAGELMEKIICLYQRNHDGDRLVRNEVVEGAEWVLNGEGRATRKFDGTACMVTNGRLFKRYEVKRGKTAPPDFVPATDIDPRTGKQQGWRPVTESPDNKYHLEAFDAALVCFDQIACPDGTYELVGPKIQGNPEGYEEAHRLLLHGACELKWTPHGTTMD